MKRKARTTLLGVRGVRGVRGRKACPKMVSRDGLPRARCVEMEGPDPKKIVYEVLHRTV